jgi:hypothetical protein
MEVNLHCSLATNTDCCVSFAPLTTNIRIHFTSNIHSNSTVVQGHLLNDTLVKVLDNLECNFVAILALINNLNGQIILIQIDHIVLVSTQLSSVVELTHNNTVLALSTHTSF